MRVVVSHGYRLVDPVAAFDAGIMPTVCEKPHWIPFRIGSYAYYTDTKLRIWRRLIN